MTLLLLLVPAFAGEVFASIDPEITQGMGGTWARYHATEAGYWFFQVAGSDGWMEDVAEDLSGYDDRARIQLTHVANLQDTQVERCPDGGWLLIGSYTIDSFDDSSAAWRFEEDFTERWHFTIAERDPSHKHNDMVVVCTPLTEGVIFDGGEGSSGGQPEFIEVTGGELGKSYPLQVGAQGASAAFREEDSMTLVVDANGAGSEEVRVHVFDAEWNETDKVIVPLSGGKAKWPQRFQPYGDGWLLTYLTNTGAGPDGDIWLAALDADFNLIERIQVTDNGENDNRPWFARRGSSVVVSYDRNVQPRATFVRLADDGGDDGIPDTGEGADDGDDTGEGGGDSADTADGVGGGGDVECLCAAGSPLASGAGILLGAAAVLGARRPSRSGRTPCRPT